VAGHAACQSVVRGRSARGDKTVGRERPFRFAGNFIRAEALLATTTVTPTEAQVT
jgi:hypothetical protein